MDGLKLYLIGLLLFGVVMSIIGWADYKKNHHKRGAK